MTYLKFYGLGGQGVVTAAKILSSAVSLHEGKYAITVPAYGHERRGAPVYTDIVIDNVPVLLNCFVYEPDIVLVMDTSLKDKNVDIGKGIHDETVLVLNTPDYEQAAFFKSHWGFKEVHYVDATEIAMETIHRPIPNISMLGVLARTGVVGIDSVQDAVREKFSEKAGDINANAAYRAYEQTNQA